MAIEGYEVPLVRSLTEPILIGGVPREIAILNATFCTAIGFGTKSAMIIPISIILHLIFVKLTKKDPEFFKCFKRHIKQKDYYTV